MTAWLWDRLRPWHFRGKRRLMARLGPRTGRRQARIFNADFDLDLTEPIQRLIYWGAYETLECRAAAALLRPGMTVVDAGANLGLYTALAAARVGPGGRVFAYEPSPEVFPRLRRLIEQNRLDAVEAMPMALGERSGEQRLYGDTLAPPDDGAGGVLVTTRTLDGEAERLGMTRIDLLKLDVEGYEERVLEGARGLLAEGRIGAILCEFREPELRAVGSSVAALQKRLVRAGFCRDHRLPMRYDNRMFRLKIAATQQL